MGSGTEAQSVEPQMCGSLSCYVKRRVGTRCEALISLFKSPPLPPDDIGRFHGRLQSGSHSRTVVLYRKTQFALMFSGILLLLLWEPVKPVK